MMWRVAMLVMIVMMVGGSFAAFELCADLRLGKCRRKVWLPFLVGGLVMGAVAVWMMVIVVRMGVGL